MKRRSKVSGRPAKPHRRITAKPKHRKAESGPIRPLASAAGEQAESPGLVCELSEAREQQRATSEVLKIISSFGAELKPVFEAILENATRICDAKYGNLYLPANGAFQVVASHHTSSAFAKERLRGPPIEPAPGTALGRALRTKAAVQIADVETDPDFPRDHPLRSIAAREGVRTVACVPMI